MRAKIAFLFQILILVFISSSCTDDEPEIIPDVYVNFQFSIYEPGYNNLTVIYGATKKEYEGYDNNGVIVFRSDLNEYKAFDATCPQHITISTSVNLNENGSGKATCPHCQTVYYLMNNGYPANGYRLKQYRTSSNGEFVSVFN